MRVENFPKMGKEIVIQVQETQRVPNRIKPRPNTPRHILIKLTKIKHKEQILKEAREKQQIHNGLTEEREALGGRKKENQIKINMIKQ